MQPLFTQNQLFLTVLVVSYLIWATVEVSVDIRQRRRFRAGAQRLDKGSYLIIGMLIRIGAGLGLVLAFTVPATAITFAREGLFWLGIALVYAGLAIRLYAITVLGRYFTTHVAVVADQQVVENGPYRFIRHPAYTGLLVILFGFGLCTTNWLSLLVSMGCVVLGVGYRIRIEEHVLQAHLGQPYQEYMRRTKRLIPFVL